MLLELHVKNLALIEKVDIDFREGLNILTGETGAGKSVIIGSIGLALGAKASKDIIRQGAEYAYIELIFSVEDDRLREKLKTFSIDIAEGEDLIISRKIMPARSVSRVNDETVTAAGLKDITGLLLDIHGQHEHQSLLYKNNHLKILDEYIKQDIKTVKEKLSIKYNEYNKLKKALERYSEDTDQRQREADLLRFETDEIENACIKTGEEEELEAKYKKYSNSQKIIENMSEAYNIVNECNIGAALSSVSESEKYDGSLKHIKDMLFDAEAVMNDAVHAINEYMEDCTYDEEDFESTEKRLDLIHNLQAKYGAGVSDIEKALEEKKARLDELDNYDELKSSTKKALEAVESELSAACEKLSSCRKKASKELSARIKDGLADLNFPDVQFGTEFTRLSHYTENGYDEAEFLFSANKGEPLRPLSSVASGGELSRVMLAIKTVLADSDEIPTLIFDEIDTGISGRTAQKVSEKLSYIAGKHQVICITHLPQIAAMADSHYEISKTVSDGKTVTLIRALSHDESIQELARLLGGVEITDAVLKNAVEMKNLADTVKNSNLKK